MKVAQIFKKVPDGINQVTVFEGFYDNRRGCEQETGFTFRRNNDGELELRCKEEFRAEMTAHIMGLTVKTKETEVINGKMLWVYAYMRYTHR